MWRRSIAIADALAGREPPAYRDDDPGSAGQQVWQQPVGDAVAHLAFVHLVTQNRKYLDAASSWANASCAYPTWGLGQYDGVCVSACRQLFGLAALYDWTRDALDDATRSVVGDTLRRRASALCDAIQRESVSWHRAYLSHRLPVAACALAAAGFSVFEEDEEAGSWVWLALHKLRACLDALSHDGSGHEGLGHWEVGVEHLLKLTHLAEELVGVDLHDHPWLRAAPRYALYMAVPRASWSREDCVVDLGDATRAPKRAGAGVASSGLPTRRCTRAVAGRGGRGRWRRRAEY